MNSTKYSFYITSFYNAIDAIITVKFVFLIYRKVLYRLDLDLSDEVIRALVKSKKKVVERVLMLLRLQIDKAMEKMQRHKERVKHLQASSSKGKAVTIICLKN